jgi:hypothetical protein
MALRADLFHVDLGLDVVGAMSGNRIRKVPAEPVGRIVCNLEAVDATHVAGRAGRHKHISRSKRAWVGIKLKQIALSGEHDTMLGFVVNFDL